MKPIVYFIFASFLILSPINAWSGSPWLDHDDYGDKAHAKLGFGLKNFVAGWTELLTEPYDAMHNDGNIVEGLFRGIFHTIGREIGGVLHVITYPITNIDIPLPENGQNLWPFDKASCT